VCPEPLSPHIKAQLSRINTVLSRFESVSVDLSSGLERLHGLVKHLATRVDDIDGQGTVPTIVYFTLLNNARLLVDRYLNRCAITSPPGTLLLSLRGLLLENDDLVRTALVLRVMRYVSSYPWGSIHADGKRRRSMRDQILARLWSLNPFENGKGPFVAGGGVLWTPVLVNGTRIKTPDRPAHTGADEGETVAWLASRQPPMKMRRMDGLIMVNPLHIDATETIKQKLEDTSPLPVDLLYDCRFLVRLHLSNMPLWVYNELRNPEKQARIRIVPRTQWYWPKIVLENGVESRVLYSNVPEHEESLMPSRLPQTRGSKLTEKYWMRGDEVIVSDWIQVKWVRPLSRI
jgi:tRNA(Ile)-lysidine synthase